MGCVMQVGDQSLNVGRNAVLAAGWPETVPATTIDRQCGSSQQSVHFAAQGVIAGAYDIVVAAGVEVMSTTPMGASVTPGSFPFGPTAMGRYADREHYGTRASSPRASRPRSSPTSGASPARTSTPSASSSQQTGRPRHATRAASTTRSSRSAEAPRQGDRRGHRDRRDRHRRRGHPPDSSPESLAKLKPAFVPENGKVTAGNSSQITDGASAVLIMSEEKAKELGLKPRARFHTFALAGVDPVMMLTGPIPSTKKALEKSGLSIDDIDLFEINEAFASVVLAWEKELGPDMSKVNVNGGAIALGHPLGCSGTKLMATLLNELERTGGRYGLQTMCEGGGLANATIIERLD